MGCLGLAVSRNSPPFPRSLAVWGKPGSTPAPSSWMPWALGVDLTREALDGARVPEAVPASHFNVAMRL